MSFLRITIYLSLFATLVSCSDGGESPKYTVDGQVLNKQGLPVGNARVALLMNGKEKFFANSDANGKYQITGVTKGKFKLLTSREGYFKDSSNLDISGNLTRNLNVYGSGRVKGKIINSQNGSGLADASLGLYFTGSVAGDTLPDIFVKTDASGNFEADSIPFGEFKGLVKKSGYFPRDLSNVQIFNESLTNLPNEILVKSPGVGEFRIVLSWGQSPLDLDAHLTGPTSNGSQNRFHLYYSNRNTGDCNLDVDDTQSFGPETVTITDIKQGQYRYSIHNYTDQSNMGGAGIQNSPAIVELYNSTGLLQRLTAPSFSSGSGNTWRVFEINVASPGNSQVNVINQYIQASSSGDVGAFRIGNKPPLTFGPKDF